MDDMLLDKKKPAKKLARQPDIPEPVFTPPEEVAAAEEAAEEIQSLTTPEKPSKTAWWHKISQLSKKQKILFGAAVAIVILGGGTTAALLLHKKPVPVKVVAPAPVVQKVVEPPKPTTVAGKLTGVQMTPELNQRGVTGVMVENSIDARPQSGLLDAGIVYEAIAEGGITRFLTLFQEGQPDYIGPVRSARPYYIRWLLPYSASYMHIGGSAVALQMIAQTGIRDIGEGGSDNPISRISTRYQPHNAYTSMAKLDKVRVDRGWGNPDFTGLARKAEAPSKAPTAIAIGFKISGEDFNVHYDYDAVTNSYKRSEGGKPHLDEKSGKQLSPKVVVSLIIPYSIDPDDIHSDYKSIGSGEAYIFQDGTAQDVMWSKPTDSAPLILQDSTGKPVPINPGQTWFTALAAANLSSYIGPTTPAVAGN